VFRGDTWIITAAHVLDYLQVEPEHVLVPVTLEPGPFRFFKTVSVLRPCSVEEPDAEWLDLVMIRVQRDERPFAYVDLDREPLAPLERATFDHAVRVYGFPRSLDTAIDYEARTVAIESFGVDGAYWGRQASSDFIHHAIFETFGKVESLNGMSGGPVFFAHEGHYFFAGTVITGGVEAHRMRFIDARAILKTLRWHYDEDLNGPNCRDQLARTLGR